MAMNPYSGNPDSFPASFDIPDNAEPPSADIFDVGLESLGDRTAALANGYQAPIADLATLKAIDTTSLPDGAVRIVGRLGRYVLDKTVNPTFAEDQPACVAPTTGTGRWFAQDVERCGYTKTFTTAATAWTCPPNLSRFRVIACGGGGGGGGGGGATTTPSQAPGGGGGAGAPLVVAELALTPGDAYTMSAGGGGAGGAAGIEGTDGGNSGIVDTVGPTIVFAAVGGQGGSAGTTALGASGTAKIVPGGTAISGARKSPGFDASALGAATPMPLVASAGGFGVSKLIAASADGVASPIGGNGGSAGAQGANAGGNVGGGGGGGGGGGPVFGATGGTGGAGGAGNASAAGANGSAGLAPLTANTGAGGGGGGGGGAGASASSSGGAGGNGAAGFVTIRAIA